MRFDIGSAVCAALWRFVSALSARVDSPVADAAMNGDYGGGKIADAAEGRRKRHAGRWRYRHPVGGLSERPGNGGRADRGGRECQAGQSGRCHTACPSPRINGSAPDDRKAAQGRRRSKSSGSEGETPLMLASRNGNLDAMQGAARSASRRERERETARDHGPDVGAGAVASRGGQAARRSTARTCERADRHRHTQRAQQPGPYRQQRLHSSFGVGWQNGGTGETTEPAAGSSRSSAGRRSSAAARSEQPGSRHRSTSERENVALPVKPATQDFAALFRSSGAEKDGGGLTPLVYAAREDCLECAKTLVEAGADVNQTTHSTAGRRC